MKLLHEQGKDYKYSKVGLTVDGGIYNLPVNSEGVVEPENRIQARKLKEIGFSPVDGEISDVDYALADKTVGESKEYVDNIDDVERLKELRKLEAEGKNRKNTLELIDDRIKDVKPEPEEKNVEHESVEKQDDNSGEEDGEEVEK